MSQTDFCTAMGMVAKMAGFPLSQDIVEFYLAALKPHGIDEATAALLKLAESVTPRSGMPSVAHIRQAMGAREMSHDEIGRDIAEAIARNISWPGRTRPELARERLGEIGWTVVEKCGGWERVCETATEDDAPILKAHWRELAKAVAATHRAPAPAGSPSLKAAARPGLTLVRDTVQSLVEAKRLDK